MALDTRYMYSSEKLLFFFPQGLDIEMESFGIQIQPRVLKDTSPVSLFNVFNSGRASCTLAHTQQRHRRDISAEVHKNEIKHTALPT